MSEFKVPLTTILSVDSHPNADRLSLVTVYGFQVVIKKDSYKVGDQVVYIPIDSIIPEKLESYLFPPDSKVKLEKRRVKQIRLRKIASQGMIVSPGDVSKVYDFTPNKLEQDLAAKLDITKYEPPAPKFQSNTGSGARKIKAMENPYLHKYNGLDNLKWFPTLFKEGELVVIEEKIHGSNTRFSKLPYAANTVWKKIKQMLRIAPAFEFCYGSNNVQLQERTGYTGFYGSDVYGKLFQSIGAENKVRENETIFGELYGSGIQKDYAYGCKDGEHKFVLFDVKILNADGTQSWLGPDQVAEYAKERGFDMVPILYRGPFSAELAKQLTVGNSVLCPSQKIREGVVVKAVEGYSDERGNKKALKVISEAYLDNDNTDFH